MTTFQEGQKVEVWGGALHHRRWRRAKIVGIPGGIQSRIQPNDYEVQFTDGSFGVFAEDQIRSSAAPTPAKADDEVAAALAKRWRS